MDNFVINHLRDIYGLNSDIPHLAQQFPRLPPSLLNSHPMFKIHENPMREKFAENNATINQKLQGFQRMYQQYASGLLTMNSTVIPPEHPLYSRKNSVQTLMTENDRLLKENAELKKKLGKDSDSKQY